LDDADDGWGASRHVGMNTEKGDEEVDFDSADVLSKLLGLINQVRIAPFPSSTHTKFALYHCQIRSSPQAKAYFLKQCEKEGITPLELINWIRTRWGSMADLIERAIYGKVVRAVSFSNLSLWADELIKPLNNVTSLADDDPAVPKLKNKKYEDYKLRKEEWDLLEIVLEVLMVCTVQYTLFCCDSDALLFQEPRKAQSSFSSETRPTLWRVIPVLETCIERWKVMMDTPKFACVRDGLEAGIEQMLKYYRKVENGVIYFTAMGIWMFKFSLHSETNSSVVVLDPRLKGAYTRLHWSKKDQKAAMDGFEKLVGFS
jgi:hypothetical protein